MGCRPDTYSSGRWSNGNRLGKAPMQAMSALVEATTYDGLLRLVKVRSQVNVLSTRRTPRAIYGNRPQCWLVPRP